MYGIPKNKRQITPQKAVKLLAEYGTKITVEQAEMVLEFMYDFAKLAVNQQLQDTSGANDPLIRHPGPG